MGEAVFARIDRDLVVVSGPDATTFLQSLLSQDLDPVAVGETAHALFLEPRGKLVADLRVKHVADDEWWCVCESGVGAALASGLNRFKIRVKVEIEERPVVALAVRGADAHALDFERDGADVGVDWPGQPGFELLGSADVIAGAAHELLEDGLVEIDGPAYEAARIEAGVPRQGFDIDESTIAQEAYLDRAAVSFTKGCFVGQELVCRIDTRGHVNRLLRRLRADVPMARGAAVEHDGRAVGTVTSAAGTVALATLRREVEADATVLVHADGGEIPARVESLE